MKLYQILPAIHSDESNLFDAIISNMTKNRKPQSATTERAALPKIQKDEHGAAVLMCPFCEPSHILSAVNRNGCGSVVEMRVTQIIYRAKYNPKMICVKCAKGGGEMVQYLDALIHIPDCMPGTVTMVDPPVLSKSAEFVNKLPKPIKGLVEKVTGQVMPVEEVTTSGVRTGNVFGYFFKSRSKT